MKLRIVYTLLFILPALISFSQGAHEDEQKVYLLKQAVKKVTVFKNGKINHEIAVDTSLKTVEFHSLPVKSGEKVLTAYQKKYFFNQAYRVDSILYILCHIDADSTSEGLRLNCSPDSSIFIYNYDLLSDMLLHKKGYVIKNAQKEIRSTDYYGYDDKKRLVLEIQSEGRTQFYYTYDSKGRITKETIGKTTILYEYNPSGMLKTRRSDSQTISYEYFSTKLLKKKTITGTDEGVWAFSYE